SDKQTNRYLKYLYNRRRRTGLPHFTQIKRLLKAPGWEIAVRFYDKCFMLKYIGTKHLSVNSGDFRSQILFPKVVSSRLNKNTNLFKNFFINKKVNVYKKKSNIYKKIEFSNYDNSKLIVPIGYNNQLPQLSTFFKNTFFKPNKSELVF